MVDYRAEGRVAVLEVNNPPVNALSKHVREGIVSMLERAANDSAVSAVVICGKGSFIAGADIKEFGKGGTGDVTSLGTMCGIIESSRKPVVAAIKGFALGGGLEIAISCHYRLGHEKASFGWPEVDIGILPGASGTQRFPRLAGLKAALDMIPTGRRIGAKEASKLGILDKVVSGDVVQEAIKFAASVANQPLEGRITSRRPVKGAENAAQLREAAARRAMAKSKGMIAPIHCINAVMASVKPFEQGMEIELQESIILHMSGQSRALQYAFFAQRMATKWELPGGASFKTVKGRPIKTGAVIGAGTMGTGIAMAMLNAGITVTLVEQNEKFLEKGVGLLRQLYAGSVALGRLTEGQAKALMGRLTPALNYDGLRNMDMVIEAVYENMSLKKEIFAKLDKATGPDTFLWSNTSGLDIDEIASVTSKPDMVLGTHFFVPAYYMRLLENVRGKKTSPETIAAAQQFGVKIGKVPVVVGNCPGFVGNRMLGPYGTECAFLLEEGCLPEEVDEVAENFGMPLGILKIGDLSGLDIGWSGRKERAKNAGVVLDSSARYVDGRRYCGLADMLCERGRLGRKTGSGWYNYGKPGGKVPQPDSFVREMILQYSEDRGIKRRKIPTKEIEERLFFGLINEGFKVLEEGIASKPEDIDTVWLLGYGWPRQTGGPMFYANQIGLQRVYDRVCHYYQQDPYTPHWQPSLLLKKLASNNVPMNRWASIASGASKL